MRDEWAILRANGVPVITVHVLDVEKVPVAALDFIEDGEPFFARHAIDLEIAGGNGLLFVRTADFVTLEIAIHPGKDKFAVLQEGVTARAFGNSAGFALFEFERVQGGLHA